MSTVLTAKDIEDIVAKGGDPVAASKDAILTPSAKDVLRDCASVLERLFALRPLVTQAEGSETEVPAGYDAGRFRLTGNVQGEPPFLGTLVHAGWEATRCEVPHWSGNEQSAHVVAPVDVQLK